MIQIPEIAFGFIMFLLLMLAAMMLHKIIKRKDNQLDWSQLVTVEVNGVRELSITKVGMCLGMIVSTWAVMLFSLKLAEKLTETTYVVLFGLWLTFIAGVEAYSKWMRNKTQEGK